VSVQAVVDIAGRMVALAGRAPYGPAPQVTPARVDDLDMAIDILVPVLRHLGGTVVDVPRIAAEGSADTLSNPGQEAVICSALEHAGSTGARQLVFADDEHGRHRAFWAEERTAGATSPSTHMLLGLATATIDERLVDPGTLVIVVYDEAHLDPIERPLAWDYATQVMPQRMSGAPSHVVVVVAAERAADYQLRGDPSLRWSVDGLRVAERKLASTNRSLTQRLVATSGSHVVLFLAAGFSNSMGMPLGNKMRNFALRRLLPDRSGLPDDKLPEEFYALVGDQVELLEFEKHRDVSELALDLTFERVLREELRVFHPSPTLTELRRLEGEALAAPVRGAVRHLHSILSGTRKLILITVNFDRLIENGQQDKVKVFADNTSFVTCVDYLDRYLAGAADATKVPLLKLHGSFAAQETLIASIEQTLTGLTTEKADSLDRACRQTGATRVPFIYVGSSMRDLDIGPHLAQPRFAKALDEHWVMPLSADSVTEFVQRHRVQPWRNAGARDSFEERVITWTADEFLELLAKHW
jgi:hypothetical protein